MTEESGVGVESVELHKQLHVAEDRSLGLERTAERQRRRIEESEEKICALEATIAFLRAHNTLLTRETRQLTHRLGEFERLAARQVDGLVSSGVEMTGLVAKKNSALAAFLDAECFPRFSSRYKAPVAYEASFYDAIQAMDSQQIDIIKKALRSLVDHGTGGTTKQGHRKVERLIEGVPVPVGIMVSFPSKRLRYFWILTGEGTERNIAVYFADKYK